MILPTADGPYEVPSHVRAGLFAKYSTYGRGIDVDRELAKMSLWLETNTSRRPKMKTVLRFVQAWLDKEVQGAKKRPPLSWAPEVRYVPHIPVNGAAAPFPLNGAPPERALPVLALVSAAAPPPIRSANGPRSISDVLAHFKQAIRSAK